MVRIGRLSALAGVLLLLGVPALAADTVPPAVKLPGTQPGEVSGIESVTKCKNCHTDIDKGVEIVDRWAGSMMAHASRDPIFWATVAIAEQDFDGAGDLCIRCHTPEGWLDGRSTPTDGSGLAAGDSDGVQCDVCHRLTNPDGSEHVGIQNPPFVANDGGTPPVGYYGAGMYAISDGNAKLGPYDQTAARHQDQQSLFHRSSAMCGTCHDVSNPVTGDLAHNNGAQTPLAPGTFSGDPVSPVDQKAAFNNPPYAYGVVERTFSEHMASAWPQTLVSGYAGLPPELQAGSVEAAWQAAQLAGNGGDYADGTPRAFTCQTCHMPPSMGEGCDKNPGVRTDLPQHNLVGGNYWMPDAIQWLDAQGKLVLGGQMTDDQNLWILAGKGRAEQNLSEAASLHVSDNLVSVVNLTGHKLISGYPEGRRMWLSVRWYDASDALLAEDGAYGSISAQIDGSAVSVDTLLDLHPPYTPLYEIHGALTQEWAAQLVGLGTDPTTPLAFDRETGAVTRTLGDVANAAPGTAQESFHFVWNNTVTKDNRIPPYGMRYDDAVVRNILPVPADQYGAPSVGGTYRHWDEVALNPPAGAARAEIDLLYQPTSWEYVQFLSRANTAASAFLANEGENLLDAWLATGMAQPYVMASAAWAPGVPACADGLDNDGDGTQDYPDDPGCASAVDESENDASLPCDDRIDDDGDGLVDYPRDPGCWNSTWLGENPACQNGIDDDGDGGVDYDGAGTGAADPQCLGKPYRNNERPNPKCGLGVELALGGLLALGLRARRPRGRRRQARA